MAKIMLQYSQLAIPDCWKNFTDSLPFEWLKSWNTFPKNQEPTFLHTKLWVGFELLIELRLRYIYSDPQHSFLSMWFVCVCYVLILGHKHFSALCFAHYSAFRQQTLMGPFKFCCKGSVGKSNRPRPLCKYALLPLLWTEERKSLSPGF